jgi:hypothetical protein
MQASKGKVPQTYRLLFFFVMDQLHTIRDLDSEIGSKSAQFS